MRSQAEAGARSADLKGYAPTLLAVAERYPALKADQSFLALQKTLSDTEQRIALARGYFNDIVTFYNTRLEVIPDRFVGGMARLFQAEPLKSLRTGARPYRSTSGFLTSSRESGVRPKGGKEKSVNPTIETILKRKSIRAYDTQPIETAVKDEIIQATLRAPTAGNLMLYSIIEVNDQEKKNTLARTCDNQPFIAKAPWVLLFLADYQRWHDYFLACDVEKFCTTSGLAMRLPAEGDLMLACCDAVIAAQTTVIAAEALGIGSCYIGDIMENYEAHQALFDLPRYTFPICMLCLGYPDKAQKERKQPARFDRKFIVFQDSYLHLKAGDFDEMFRAETAARFQGRSDIEGAVNVGQQTYRRKFAADFSLEMNRSVRAILKHWANG